MKKVYLITLSIFLVLAINAQGVWTQKTNFGGVARRFAVGFSIGEKGYIGSGEDVDNNVLNDFWEYNPATNVWTQKANVGGTGRFGAVGFSINGKGYIGTGRESATYTEKKDFWEYSPTTNTWIQKADFSGIKRSFATGVSIDNAGYIGTGTRRVGGFHPYTAYYYDFWAYIPTSNTWTQKANVGTYTKRSAVGFSIGTKIYVGTGHSNSGRYKDFWEYNPSSNTWTQKADYGGNETTNAISFTINNYGYIATGYSDTYTKAMWKYNPTTNTWIQKSDFGGAVRSGASSFSINNKGYLGTGYSHDGTYHFYKDFWEYSPAPNVPVATTATNIDFFSFSANWNASPDGEGYYLDVDDNSDFSSPLLGYNNLDVGNVLTYNITGLNETTTYYYRVRAYDAIGTSVSSNTINITTNTIPSVTTWVGPEPAHWDNGTPIAEQDATIDFLYDENTNIVCNDLTINADKNLEIQPSYNVTVNGNLTNNGTVILKSPTDLNPSGSLITKATLTNNGTMQAERWINADVWHIMSLPTNAPLAVENPFYLDWVYTYDEAYSGSENDDAWNYLSEGDIINPMHGYLVKSYTGDYNGYTGNGSYKVMFNGTFNTGANTLSNLSYTNEGFNLVGNPYPSAIDWNAASGWTKTALNPSIWLWNPTDGAYATWDGTTSVHGGSQYIPAMQGFFVQATNVTNTLTMTDDVRVHNATAMLKNTKTVNDLLRLQATAQSGIFDEIVLYSANDNNDSQKLFSSSNELPQLYSLEDDIKLSINKLQDVASEFDVNIGFTCGTSGTYTINASEFTFAEGISVTLEDLLTGIVTDLSKASYNFNYTTGADDLRFVLHFNKATSINKIENDFSIYSANKTIYVSNLKSKTGRIVVYNTIGQQVFASQLKANQTINLSEGIYIVSIKSEDKITNQKVILK